MSFAEIKFSRLFSVGLWDIDLKLGTMYMNLSWHNTDQVRVSSRLTYFYRNKSPLLKFSFPDFSLPSFEILTWNLVHKVMTYIVLVHVIQIKFGFVLLHLHLQGLLPFAKIQFFLCSLLRYSVEFGIWMYFDFIQIKFELNCV